MSDLTDVAVKPRGTSWLSVIGGWIASVGMTALLAPIAAGIVAARGGAPNDVSLAVPAVLVVMVAYLVGGYVAGRMAGYATSWHGLMTAFFGLFVVLAAILVGVAAERGFLGDLRIGAPDGTYFGFGPAAIGDAVTFAALIGFLAAIFAGWLGGLLAPSRRYARAARAVPVAPVHTVESVRTVEQVDTAAPVRPVDETTVVREPRPRRPAFRLLPSPGRKGGDRVAVEERHRDQTEL
jgi:hypothetical protein